MNLNFQVLLEQGFLLVILMILNYQQGLLVKLGLFLGPAEQLPSNFQWEHDEIFGLLRKLENLLQVVNEDLFFSKSGKEFNVMTPAAIMLELAVGTLILSR